ncbi:MAG: biotin-dependent carboxyltransferase family protein [Pseudomonadota bacterium]
MSALRLIDPGLAATLQDGGRRGLQRFGVPPSGALDRESLSEANALVGADPATPALEMRFLGPLIEAESPVRIATAGAALEMQLTAADGAVQTIAGWQSLTLGRGDRLRVGPLRESATAYLAVEGGFDVTPVLGAAATLSRAGIGGFEGRALIAGDRLPIIAAEPSKRPELALPPRAPSGETALIRVVMGPQADHFSNETQALFLSALWRISTRSDRMGVRLEGPKLSHSDAPGLGADITSDGIVTGAVQVPGSGQPILLLADRQTSGGYAKIAAAITADLPQLGRLGSGATIRFEAVDAMSGAAAARLAATLQARRLASIRTLPVDGFDLDALYRENLISGAISDTPTG